LMHERRSVSAVLIALSCLLYGLAFTGSWLPQATDIHSKGFHPWATLLWLISLLLVRAPGVEVGVRSGVPSSPARAA
jgi:hypothetical protein